jgi:hypothetical protein
MISMAELIKLNHHDIIKGLFMSKSGPGRRSYVAGVAGKLSLCIVK